MALTNIQSSPGDAWSLAKHQHGVITRAQLLDLGWTREGIQHRIERARLHPVYRGIYAVGRPQLDQLGRWMAAVLSCGPEALLGFQSAAALWGMADQPPSEIEVVVPSNVNRRRPGIRVHRRASLRPEDRDRLRMIPLTSPAATLIDCASRAGPGSIEAAVNAADRLGLIDPETLRIEIESTPTRPGVRMLRELLDRHSFSPTDSPLERRFLTLVRSARLPSPQTQVRVNGFRVDFYWPELGLVVETDGLRYHRTPSQQARDLKRDQTHATAGLSTLRFAAMQVIHEPSEVARTLRTVIEQLQGAGA